MRKQTKTTQPSEQSHYSSDSIKVLEGLEAVRQRPSMYIGNIGEGGLHHLVYEVVDNSIDEAMAGFCTKIDVTIHSDGAVSVTDNGRGIPVGKHQCGLSTLEVVLTKLHAGGKFDNEVYKTSGGLHGVGISVVNALSKNLVVEVCRDGEIYSQKYARGVPTTEVISRKGKRYFGTGVTFWPDDTIFTTTEFKYETLASRFRELSYLNPGVKITLEDEITEQMEEFHSVNGLLDFVENINRGDGIHPPIQIQNEFCGIVIQYNKTFSESLRSFVNNINTVEGGTHVHGFKSALTRTLNRFSGKFKITGEDVREGLTAILSLRIANPQFEGQTKTKLGNSDIRGLVDSFTYESLSKYFEDNPSDCKKIIEKAISAIRSREAAKKARELARNTAQVQETTSLPGKLAECQSPDPEERELFILEGESAGGSAKQARNRVFQAILPLRGKILNVERAGLSKVLKNEEITNIITALGTGIGGNDFNPDKCRYHKIVIMTDADVDGSHIRTLLLTFFYRQMPELIVRGYLYIAQPPLFRIGKGTYIKDEAAFDQYVFERGCEKASLVVDGKTLTKRQLYNYLRTKAGGTEWKEVYNKGKEGLSIQRYKGLGEMNPEQLWETTMDPETRTLLRVTVEDAAYTDELFSILMGDEVEPRYNFICENALNVERLDV